MKYSEKEETEKCDSKCRSKGNTMKQRVTRELLRRKWKCSCSSLIEEEGILDKVYYGGRAALLASLLWGTESRVFDFVMCLIPESDDVSAALRTEGAK